MTSWLVSFSLGLVGGITGAGAGLLRVVPVLLTGIACSLLYLTMPNRRVLLRDALLGGLLAAIAFEVMKAGFAIYVTQFATYKLVYGAFASVPIFLLWIYLSWVVVLFGAIVAAVGPEWRERAWQVEPAPGVAFFDALHILKLLNNARATGNTLTLPQLQSALKLPAAHIDAILEAMSTAQWVGKVGAGWTMVRDPALIRVADIYHLFVLREDESHRVRQPAAEIDLLARQLEARIEEILQLSLEEFFTQREPAGAAVSPIRLLERGERGPSG
jgi:membrane protein